MRWFLVLSVLSGVCVLAAVVVFVLFFGAGLPGQPGQNLPVPVGPASVPTAAPAGMNGFPATLTPANETTAPDTPPVTAPMTETPAPATETTPPVEPHPPPTVPAPSFPLPPGPAPGDPYTISPDALALHVHALINRERMANNLNSLAVDPALAGIALNHSEDMAAHGYFAHVNLLGQDPTARGDAAGYRCRKDYGSYYTYGIAENLFQNNRYSSVTSYSDGRYVYEWTSPEEIARSTVGGWMNSSGHRKNILTPTFDREGIGVAISSDDKIYITEDFC